MTSHDVQMILAAIDGVREDVAEVKSDLDEVRAEVKATNGRLRRLEFWRHGLEAVQKAHSWVRPAAIAFATGAALVAIGFLLERL